MTPFPFVFRAPCVHRRLFQAVPLAAISLSFCLSVVAEPRLPTDDAEVLQRLSAKADSPVQRERRGLRKAWAADPKAVGPAVALARHYFEATAAEGDPRYVGYAQATLAPWWTAPAPPPAVLVQRALLRQFNHDFQAAVADLEAATAAEPDNAEAWSWLAAIALVQARYADAEVGCRRLATLAPALIAQACLAQVQQMTGQADAAAAGLRQALAQAPVGSLQPAQRLWMLTRLGEVDAYRGQVAAAEVTYREALALGRDDIYLQSAMADLLLDQGRPREVLAMLQGRESADLLLLRLVLAAQAAKDPRAAAWASVLEARFEAARRRGDGTHEKEAARLALAQGRVAQALDMARHNFEIQREVGDARVLLEAAVAARDPVAAAPALKWLADTRLPHPQLRALAAQLKAAK